MIGIDSNVLLRIATADEPGQLRAIYSWIDAHAANEALYVNRLVLAEAVWTLRSVYRRDNVDIALFVDALLGSYAFVIEDEDQVVDALEMFESGSADFADCLVAAGNRRCCQCTLTFDRAWREVSGAVVLSARP